VASCWFIIYYITDGFLSLRQETGFSLVLWVQTSRVQNFITDKAFGWSQSNKVCPHSSFGIATGYGLDGPVIKSRWGGRATFSTPVQPGPGVPLSLPYNRYRVSFPGGKAAGAWRWPPAPTSTEVKESTGLCLYSLSGPSWLVVG